jgi:hypothetical protein
VLLDVDHDRHAGDVGVLGLADRERVDVEAAPGEQPGDPGQHAGLVLDQDGQRVLGSSQVVLVELGARRPRANMISSLLVPAATIGHTMASLPTR